jgi:hypothetical protein
MMPWTALPPAREWHESEVLLRRHDSEEPTVSALNAEQERLRDIAVREQEALSSALLLAKLAIDTLSTYDSDASFLRATPHETLTCPTCGAEHDKSFMEMLTYAEDARVCESLLCASMRMPRRRLLSMTARKVASGSWKVVIGVFPRY